MSKGSVDRSRVLLRTVSEVYYSRNKSIDDGCGECCAEYMACCCEIAYLLCIYFICGLCILACKAIIKCNERILVSEVMKN